MDGTGKQEEQEWLRGQLEKFNAILPIYQQYAQVLKLILEKAAKKHAPMAIVQTRPKSIAGFGEKALRKRFKYRDSINRITDLCGGRVVVPTLEEVKAISEFIENHFEIDWENTVNVSQRLKPAEFGYRGVHYIIKFIPDVFPTEDIDVEIPKKMFGLKAEIQVKTILEHTWGVFTHDRAYKGAFKIPAKWEREMAVLAAILEDVDNSFARIEAGLQRYAASYGAYMTEEQMQDEINNLKIILARDPGNTELAARIGKLAITLGNWQMAIDILSKYTGSGYQPILRDLGVAMCKLHADNTMSEEYRKGQEYLEAAIKADNRDSDALASLAGTYRGIDEEKARELYCRAFEVDPSDPYPLGNYIECEIIRLKDTSIVPLLQPVINNSIQRCREQADVGMNMPWAFYDMGLFYLLLGMTYESLAAYTKAMQLSTSSFMLETSLAALDRLAAVRNNLPGYDWACRLLQIGLAVKYPENKATKDWIKQVKEVASASSKPISGPVIIIAGGTNNGVEQQEHDYHQLMLEAFQDFTGIIISGGTTTGISSLAAEIGNNNTNTIETIGYTPSRLPSGVNEDSRYSEIRRTEGDGFSALEPLQYWTDIITSGIPLSQVKLLGVNGGDISAMEYRMALSLGVQVAVLRDSGGEAAKLVVDNDWADSKELLQLPMDAMTIRTFIGGAVPPLEPDIRETIAREIHDNYRTAKARSSQTSDQSLVEWHKLLAHLKESNLQQADDIFNKLSLIGCTVVKAVAREVARMTFTEDEIEIMAEMEHARWNVERLLDGWKLGGERDAVNKVSPNLVPWDDLPDDIKEWDRQAVRNMPELLAKVGLEIRRHE